MRKILDRFVKQLQKYDELKRGTRTTSRKRPLRGRMTPRQNKFKKYLV